MKKGVFILVVGLLEYVRSASTSSETVWLKDVTSRFQNNKRTISDLNLPDELTFHLRRGSDDVTLNLKRNHDINPNADVYFVQKLQDGQSLLAKTQNLEKENVAYYQDMDNGAFMTVRCVERSSEQCDRVINGNIRIGDSNYDLRPAETDFTTRNLLEVPRFIGKRYVLWDQANIQRDNSVKNTDTAHVHETNIEQDLVALLRPFFEQKARLSSRNSAALQNRGATDKTRDLKKVYYVEVAVLIDSGIWDLYSTMVRTSNIQKKKEMVKNKIKEAFSHIMNGVNLRFKEIEDPTIAIILTLRDFIFFQRESLFPHKRSRVTIVNDKKCIDAYKYHADLFDWDKRTGANHIQPFNHAMLFTSHDLYEGSPSNNTVGGFTFTGDVCEPGGRTSVIEAGDYVRTVKAAAHELGHNLGSWHDGEKDSIACKAEDLFIMSPFVRPANPRRPYSRNPWIFSNCSVDAFKKTLKDKHCVTNEGLVYNRKEWETYMKKQPGEVYTPNDQCHHINGPRSVYCGTVPADICHLMRCTDPKTGDCMEKYFGAARGTSCGEDMWCIEGRCVSKRSK